MMSNRSVLEKADLTLSDLTDGGGVLQPDKAQRFLRLLTRQSTLLRHVTVPPMKAPKRLINHIGFTGRILRPGTPGVALTEIERVAPAFSHVELDTQTFKAEIHLEDGILEDNLERGQLRQTIMTMIAERAAADVEEVAIQGDTSSGDPVLAQLDGLLVQAQSHVVDAAGAPLSKDLLSDLLISMPTPYRRAKRQLRYFTCSDAEITYRNTLADRETDRGDAHREREVTLEHMGIPLLPIELFPGDHGEGTDTAVLLCHPKNIHIGFWRKVRMEWARDISAGVLKIVLTLRFDVKFADELGVAKAIHVAT